MQHEILLGLTTTPRSNWKGKIAEMKKIGIKRIALFPTFLKIAERKELYKLLDEVENLTIPHVHLRSDDMEKWELEWFEKKGAEKYNIHMGKCHMEILSFYKEKIYVENHSHRIIPQSELKKMAGICLDFQHWHRANIIHPFVARKTKEYANTFVVGCCHVSPLPKLKNTLTRLLKSKGFHYMLSIDEFDYMKRYSKYLPQYISLEMENSFKEQLEVKKYLEKILELPSYDKKL